jgi:hypothetical protein
MQLRVAATFGADFDHLEAASGACGGDGGGQVPAPGDQSVTGAGGEGQSREVDAVRGGEEHLVLRQPGLVEEVEDPPAVVVADNND